MNITALPNKVSQDKHTDGWLLPNTLPLVVGSGSEEKVAKMFPKIIQTVKKQIFSFPILLRSFFSKNILNKKVLWESVDQLYIQSCTLKKQRTGQKVVWSRGLGVKFLRVCHRCGSKSSLWVAHLNIQTRLAGGEEGGGRGLNFVPAPNR